MTDPKAHDPFNVRIPLDVPLDGRYNYHAFQDHVLSEMDYIPGVRDVVVARHGLIVTLDMPNDYAMDIEMIGPYRDYLRDGEFALHAGDLYAQIEVLTERVLAGQMTLSFEEARWKVMPHIEVINPDRPEPEQKVQHELIGSLYMTYCTFDAGIKKFVTYEMIEGWRLKPETLQSLAFGNLFRESMARPLPAQVLTVAGLNVVVLETADANAASRAIVSPLLLRWTGNADMPIFAIPSRQTLLVVPAPLDPANLAIFERLARETFRHTTTPLTPDLFTYTDDGAIIPYRSDQYV